MSARLEQTSQSTAKVSFTLLDGKSITLRFVGLTDGTIETLFQYVHSKVAPVEIKRNLRTTNSKAENWTPPELMKIEATRPVLIFDDKRQSDE